MVILGLLFIYDAMRLAHRIVGPLYRFRKTIQAINAGEELDLMALRKDDFLQDMKDDFNEMLKVLEQRGAVVLKRTEAEQHRNQVLPAQHR
jgi:nitrogen fixation/metabolism regulation signal transduction histidine kinase